MPVNSSTTSSLTTAGYLTLSILPVDTDAVFLVSGTYTSAVFTIEGSRDGGTVYFPLGTTNIGSGAAVSSTSNITPTNSSTVAYRANVQGLTNARLNLASLGSGTLAVQGQSGNFFKSPQPQAVTVSGAQTLSDGTNNFLSASAANVAAAVGTNSLLSTSPGNWSVVHLPTTATQATIAKAAVTSTKHVVTTIHASIATGATAQTPLTITLTEETTGTVLWNGALACPANSSASINLTGLNLIQSTANKGLTLAFSGAGVSASQEAVMLAGYDVV